MRVRRAVIKDAPGIAKVHVDSWRTTYKGIIPTEFLDKLSVEERKILWEKNILRDDNFVIVAENKDGQIIGFADTSKRENNIDENTTDLTSIYILQSCQGYGIGKKLVKSLFEYYKAQGYEKVYVDVLSDNKTRFFYEYYGAKHVKNIQISIGGKLLEEFVYEWNSIDTVLEKLV